MSGRRDAVEVLVSANAGDSDGSVTRRALLTGAATVVGAAVLGNVDELAAAAQGQATAPRPVAPSTPVEEPARLLGAPTSAIGARSPFVHVARTPSGDINGSSLTPLQDLTGTITPADLHFERHHAGVPLIDPAKHTLLVHGLVDRAIAFSVDDLKRFPQATRTCFIECSGNGEMAFRAGALGIPNPGLTPQYVAGLTGNSEWTGVPLQVLLRE